MMVDVPEGRTVHVIVGDVRPITVPERAQLVDERMLPNRRRRPLLMATAGFCILAVGFVLGHRTIASHAEADQPVASAALPAPPSGEPRLGGQGLPTAPSSDAGRTASGPAADNGAAGGQVPSAFTQQLKAPPQVMPAPGAPPEGEAPAKNPFGLGD
jgi:hypothetical protein